MNIVPRMKVGKMKYTTSPVDDQVHEIGGDQKRLDDGHAENDGEAHVGSHHSATDRTIHGKRNDRENAQRDKDDHEGTESLGRDGACARGNVRPPSAYLLLGSNNLQPLDLPGLESVSRAADSDNGYRKRERRGFFRSPS